MLTFKNHRFTFKGFGKLCRVKVSKKRHILFHVEPALMIQKEGGGRKALG